MIQGSVGECPFTILKEFISVHAKYVSDTEQFFVFSDGSPVGPQHLHGFLKKLITFNDLNSKSYSVHMIRSG